MERFFSFQDDEFVIYDTRQQKLCYVVEFTTNTDTARDIPPIDLYQENDMEDLLDDLFDTGKIQK